MLLEKLDCALHGDPEMLADVVIVTRIQVQFHRRANRLGLRIQILRESCRNFFISFGMMQLQRSGKVSQETVRRNRIPEIRILRG
jgi:hypothetical protein